MIKNRVVRNEVTHGGSLALVRQENEGLKKIVADQVSIGVLGGGSWFGLGELMVADGIVAHTSVGEDNKGCLALPLCFGQDSKGAG